MKRSQRGTLERFICSPESETGRQTVWVIDFGIPLPRSDLPRSIRKLPALPRRNYSIRDTNGNVGGEGEEKKLSLPLPKAAAHQQPPTCYHIPILSRMSYLVTHCPCTLLPISVIFKEMASTVLVALWKCQERHSVVHWRLSDLSRKFGSLYAQHSDFNITRIFHMGILCSHHGGKKKKAFS